MSVLIIADVGFLFATHSSMLIWSVVATPIGDDLKHGVAFNIEGSAS